jgi:hypothetical protein
MGDNRRNEKMQEISDYSLSYIRWSLLLHDPALVAKHSVVKPNICGGEGSRSTFFMEGRKDVGTGMWIRFS